MNTRAPERFDRIDVPHSGNDGLIEQRRLDRSLAPSERFAKSPRGESTGEWIRAQRRERKR